MCTNFRIVHSRFVPCGKCEECLNVKRRAEFNRLKMAFNDSYCCYHITLTYSDKYIDSVSFDNVRRFLAKLRKKYPDFKFEYYCVHENGEKNGREHFHLLLFSSRMSPFFYFHESIARMWKYGFVKIRQVQSPSRFYYLTNYLFKQYGNDKDFKVSVKRNYSCSPRLGFNGFIKEYNIDKGNYYVDSWSRFPRCFKKLYFKYIEDSFAHDSLNVINSFYKCISGDILTAILSPEIINFCYDKCLVNNVCCKGEEGEKYFIRSYNEYFSILNKNKDKMEFKLFVFVSKYIIPYVPSILVDTFLEFGDQFLIKNYISLKPIEIKSEKVSNLNELIISTRDDRKFDCILKNIFPSDRFEYFIGCFKYLYF